MARDQPHHTPATTPPTHHRHTPHTTHHTPHTTHPRRQRTPARSGGDRPPPPAAKPSQEWRGVAHRNLRQGWRGTNHTTHQPKPHQHTTATHHTPHTTHHRRQRTPARSGGDRPPPPAARPSQEWRGVAHRNLRQAWRGTNHTTHQPQPHQHTTATHHTPHTRHHTPHTTAASGPQPGVAGTAHHHRQRNPARSGGAYYTGTSSRSGEGPTTPHTSHNPTNTPHATRHTPDTTAASGPQPGVAGTAHHHRQRNPARSGGE